MGRGAGGRSEGGRSAGGRVRFGSFGIIDHFRAYVSSRLDIWIAQGRLVGALFRCATHLPETMRGIRREGRADDPSLRMYAECKTRINTSRRCPYINSPTHMPPKMVNNPKRLAAVWNTLSTILHQLANICIMNSRRFAGRRPGDRTSVLTRIPTRFRFSCHAPACTPRLPAWRRPPRCSRPV